eukprot:GILK01011911.1.p1 GENE.GILK01011911.1~~GILK01011911.1.p1  ORF type:complete len:1109 (-),score=182.75 GILK01011911.1:135-3461(-)
MSTNEQRDSMPDIQELRLPPVTPTLQLFTLYQSKSESFIVGSDSARTQFRVLKFLSSEVRTGTGSTSKTDAKLVMQEDPHTYSQEDISELLTVMRESSGTLQEMAKGFGLVGFIRFLEGYYLLLITQRKQVGQIGTHAIFSIEDTAVLPLFESTSDLTTRQCEQRYKRLLLLLDLRKDFFFSYTYNLTQTLQFNMAYVTNNTTTTADTDTTIDPTKLPHTETVDDTPQVTVNGDHDKQSAARIKTESTTNRFSKSVPHHSRNRSRKTVFNIPPPTVSKPAVPCPTACVEDVWWASSGPIRDMFVWNYHLLRDVMPNVKSGDWILPIIHGYYGQTRCTSFGKTIDLILIARRSRHFAGTRYLKRGLNGRGHVANDVETEQIVHDRTTASFLDGRFSAFVQMRGSIPLFWSQEGNPMVPKKPAIVLNRADPLFAATRLHFYDLFQRYGSPCLVLNLVKQVEKHPREQVIGDAFSEVIRFINSGLPVEHQVQYKAWDYNRASKGASKGAKSEILFQSLHVVGDWVLSKTNFFMNKRPAPNSIWKGTSNGAQFQIGVVRTNCIDCLDRTNAVQFFIGKHALACQLHAMGLLQEPRLEFDAPLTSILSGLFEVMGDQLALQYGGSLAHHKHIYARTPLVQPSRELLTSLRRYYSNAFTDQEKQDAINLFLGLFDPRHSNCFLWEMDSDYALHHMHNPDLLIPTDEREAEWWYQSISNYLCSIHGKLPQNVKSSAGTRHRRSRSLSESTTSRLSEDLEGSRLSSSRTLSTVSDSDVIAYESSQVEFNRNRQAHLTAKPLFSHLYQPTRMSSFDDMLQPSFLATTVVMFNAVTEKKRRTQKTPLVTESPSNQHTRTAGSVVSKISSQSVSSHHTSVVSTATHVSTLSSSSLTANGQDIKSKKMSTHRVLKLWSSKKQTDSKVSNGSPAHVDVSNGREGEASTVEVDRSSFDVYSRYVGMIMPIGRSLAHPSNLAPVTLPPPISIPTASPYRHEDTLQEYARFYRDSMSTLFKAESRQYYAEVCEASKLDSLLAACHRQHRMEHDNPRPSELPPNDAMLSELRTAETYRGYVNLQAVADRPLDTLSNMMYQRFDPAVFAPHNLSQALQPEAAFLLS